MSYSPRILLFAPAAIAALLSLAVVPLQSAHAETDQWVNISPNASCMRATREQKRFVCKRVQAETTGQAQTIDLTNAPAPAVTTNAAGQPDVDYLSFEMTDEESDAAAALFGCDCPVCVRSLRQLRGIMG